MAYQDSTAGDTSGEDEVSDIVGIFLIVFFPCLIALSCLCAVVRTRCPCRTSERLSAVSPFLYSQDNVADVANAQHPSSIKLTVFTGLLHTDGNSAPRHLTLHLRFDYTSCPRHIHGHGSDHAEAFVVSAGVLSIDVESLCHRCCLVLQYGDGRSLVLYGQSDNPRSLSYRGQWTQGSGIQQGTFYFELDRGRVGVDEMQ
jgi:hypothetical protein